MPEAATANVVLQQALDYAGRGWLVVPLYGTSGKTCECKAGASCESAGKHPRVKEWQHEATTDESKIQGWWDKWPGSNVGVLLGERSGIIDIECDSPEADKRLLELFDGEFPITPCFQASRGRHRLFKWMPGFPKMATKSIDGIDVKLGYGNLGSQSVFPPSNHASGIKYRWLVSADDVEPADIPGLVLEKMKAIWRLAETGPGKRADDPLAVNREAAGGGGRSKRLDLIEREAVPEGERDNTIYAEACEQWRLQMAGCGGQKALDSQSSQAAVYAMLTCFNLARCKPPLDDRTILDKVESARQFHMKKKAEQMGGPSLTVLGLELRDGDYFPGQWRVEVINSDPVMARLYAPFLPKKFIELPMDEFDEPKFVHKAVMRATGVVCLDDRPGAWAGVWNGRKATKGDGGSVGLKSRLLNDSTWIEAPADIKRHAVMAQMILQKIASARKPSDKDEPDPLGRAVMMQDGSVTFQFGHILDFVTATPDRFTRNELSKVFSSVGVRDVVTSCSGKKIHHKVLQSESLRLLEHIARGGEVTATTNI